MQRAGGIELVAAGTLVGAIGLGLVAAGTGTFLETRTFTRIECGSVSVESGTVRHCTGESPAQATANDAARRDAATAALRAQRDGEPRRRTRLAFVDRDGRRDPQQVTASRVGGQWIAHSDGLVRTGTVVAIAGCLVLLVGLYRVRRG
ncbi:hypothetical protein [Actinomadura sp. WAC 06369]|uniref:hypothetical protein n=1 Tax=Actinomadura sp. WAC 06369 TaxID=2203193 RepID=UPI000F76C0DC|nr:hypothetical protein [Actinomadura sp. WAC 06369]